jgi:serine/threonine-protein kinase
VIAYLNRVGWGLGRMQIDFSIEVMDAAPTTPDLSFTRTGDFYTPDCDYTPVPVPEGGALEGESGYACLSDGDCHLIVADWRRLKLFEMWRADIRSGVFRGGCLAVWDMTRVYPPSGRGEQCTSADAAGYPIAPLLFTADEVAAGAINHAIRFILPNDRIRQGVYVHPATHGTPATRGPSDAPPYGARLRLRADYPIANLPAGARVVARAMQRYGMLLADGGNVALTAQSDRFTRAKWSGLLGPRDLDSLRPSDFEMVEGGQRIPLTLDCVRNP